LLMVLEIKLARTFKKVYKWIKDKECELVWIM
jgi:2-hydroxy-3-keto-5-methylthiopentenyl-1-phosphate phosphatase